MLLMTLISYDVICGSWGILEGEALVLQQI